MALDCKHKHPLQHDGTSRNERFLQALEPASSPIHQFDLRDWMRFAYHYAARLNYFRPSDPVGADGNWQEFMKAEGEIEEWLKDAELVAGEKWLTPEERERICKRQPRGDYPPHLALFLSFLKLLRFSQEQMNGLTARHLDFYYSRVLQLARKPAVPDRVHILFELAKNAVTETVPKDTVLDGGKDGTGKPLRYATEEEITVDRAAVALIKSVYHRPGATVRYAEMTDSQDGLGTEFKEEYPSWNPFGSDLWPVATLGFALASKVLLMKEGERKITLSLTLKLPAGLALPEEKGYRQQLLVLLSGEKEWLPASDLTVTAIPGKDSPTLTFTVTVDGAQQAVVPYDAKIHGESFTTNLPVIRVLVNSSTPAGYGIYGLLSRSTVTNAVIDVSVTGARDLVVENDQGRLNAAKPFHPYGPVPQKGSGFYIGSTEIFQKDWQQVTLNISWQDKPPLLTDHYAAYRQNDLSGDAIVTGEDYFTVTPQYLNDNTWFPASEAGSKANLFSPSITISREPADDVKGAPPVVPPLLLRKGIDINKAVLRNYLSPETTKKKAGSTGISNRFKAARFDPGFTAMSTVTGSFTPSTKSGFLRLVLEEDFLHDRYARLLTMVMIEKAKETSVPAKAKLIEAITAGATSEPEIPKAPYTPVIASLSVDYTASATNSFTFTSSATSRQKYDNFAGRAIQFFHEHPFGQAEQHVFLKEQCDFLDPADRRGFHLMPPYAPEGELYIGLKNARPSGSLSLLMAAVEGSENPLAPTFGDKEHLLWHSLSNNEWQPLNQAYLTADGSHDLLRPGIVRINLPASINAGNTLLDADHFWLRVSLPPGLHHTSVCRLTGIHAQAATAVFRDGGNDPARLTAPLPAGAIARVVDKPALLKGVSQPYPSFDGAMREDDRAFFLRVSERLRHKQRAVNIWDYERLVLQRFPAVHKVKCLSHTFVPGQTGDGPYAELAPGCVSLVVIPDIRNRNLFDPLQPRTSRNLLEEIEAFLASLTGLHVDCRAANPDYETVHLDFRVKFHDRYDAPAYRKVLNRDIIRFLSPWAFGEDTELHFGGRLYKSMVIRFIEERDYVDFISRFRMYHRLGASDNNSKDRSEIVASSARAILVSAREHTIDLIASDKVCDE